MLSLYNTLTRQKDLFIPQDPTHVTMYVCGVTTYDYCHLGHARSFIVFDTLFRWLQHLYPRVTYVRNITDIDDKIILRAQEQGLSPAALSAQYTDEMHYDTEALGIQKPTHEPRATAHIQEVIAHIQALCDAGYAYRSEEGDIHYAVHAFKDYGKLSGKKIEDLVAGHRVTLNTAKQHPADFVLWKQAKVGEPQWPSPFGPGRPGWHIECTCMSHHVIQQALDIHGGGLDLQFPHHENEIAQAEPIWGEPYARYWVHNGFVTVGHEKMSKSLHNFVTIRDLLATVHPEAIRLFMLKTEYRKPLNYQAAYLKESSQALSTLYRAIQAVPSDLSLIETDWAHPIAQRFSACMNDNLSTPEALVLLFELARHIHKAPSAHHAEARLLKQLAGQLGLLKEDTAHFMQWRPQTSETTEDDTTWIMKALQDRQEAKEQKQYAIADAIRQKLLDQGIVIEDTPEGSSWRRI